jgi:hypothetical protein
MKLLLVIVFVMAICCFNVIALTEPDCFDWTRSDGTRDCAQGDGDRIEDEYIAGFVRPPPESINNAGQKFCIKPGEVAGGGSCEETVPLGYLCCDFMEMVRFYHLGEECPSAYETPCPCESDPDCNKAPFREYCEYSDVEEFKTCVVKTCASAADCPEDGGCSEGKCTRGRDNDGDGLKGPINPAETIDAKNPELFDCDDESKVCDVSKADSLCRNSDAGTEGRDYGNQDGITMRLFADCMDFCMDKDGDFYCDEESSVRVDWHILPETDWYRGYVTGAWIPMMKGAAKIPRSFPEDWTWAQLEEAMPFDCNDADASINPQVNEDESCDFVDNDCDNVVDECSDWIESETSSGGGSSGTGAAVLGPVPEQRPIKQTGRNMITGAAVVDEGICEDFVKVGVAWGQPERKISAINHCSPLSNFFAGWPRGDYTSCVGGDFTITGNFPQNTFFNFHECASEFSYVMLYPDGTVYVLRKRGSGTEVEVFDRVPNDGFTGLHDNGEDRCKSTMYDTWNHCCYDETEHDLFDAELYWNNVPEGTPCHYTDQSTRDGVCQNGFCVKKSLTVTAVPSPTTEMAVSPAGFAVSKPRSCVYKPAFLGCQLFDFDGDEYKNASFACTDCFDCNDFDPDVNPGADEVIDGKDNNCNGVADETKDSDLDDIIDSYIVGTTTIDVDLCYLEGLLNLNPIDYNGCWYSTINNNLLNWAAEP